MALAVAFALVLLPFSAVEGSFGVHIFGPQFSPFGIPQSGGWIGLKSLPTHSRDTETLNSEYSHALYPIGKNQFLRIPVKGGLKVVPAPKNLEIFKGTHEFLKHVPLVKRPPLTNLGGYHFQDSSHLLKNSERPLISVPGSGNSIILIHGHSPSHHSQLHTTGHLDGVSLSGFHSYKPLKFSKSILEGYSHQKSHPVLKLEGASPLISSHHEGHSYPSLVHKTTDIEDAGVHHDLRHSHHHSIGDSLLHSHKSISHGLISSHDSTIGHDLSHAHHSDIRHDLSHGHHSDIEHDLSHDHHSNIGHDLSHDHHSALGHDLHDHHSNIGHDISHEHHSNIGHDISHGHRSNIGHDLSHEHHSDAEHDVHDSHSDIPHDEHDHHSDISHDVHDHHSNIGHDEHDHHSDIGHDVHDHHSDIEHDLPHDYRSDIQHHHDHSDIRHALPHVHSAHIKHGHHSIHDSDHSEKNDDDDDDDDEEDIEEHGLDIDNDHHVSPLHEPHIEEVHNSYAKKIRDYKLLRLSKKIHTPITRIHKKLEEKPEDKASDQISLKRWKGKFLEDIKEDVIEQIKLEIMENMREELMENMNKKRMEKMKHELTGGRDEQVEDIDEKWEDTDEKIDEKANDEGDKLDHVPIPRKPNIKFAHIGYIPREIETSKGHFPDGAYKRFQTSHHGSIIRNKKDFRKYNVKHHEQYPSNFEQPHLSHPYIPKILKSNEAIKYSGGRHPIRPVHKFVEQAYYTAEQPEKVDDIEEKKHMYFRQVPVKVDQQEQLQEEEEPKHELKIESDSYEKVQSHSYHEPRHSKPVLYESKYKMPLPRGRSKIYRNYEQPRTSSYAVEILHSRRHGNAKKDAVEDYPRNLDIDRLETRQKDEEEEDFEYMESQSSHTKESLDGEKFGDKPKTD